MDFKSFNLIAKLYFAGLAGLITFFAPCTLPIVPGYLAFIAGSSLKDLENPKTKSGARKKVFFNGLFFMVGFALVFIAFGALAGVVGQIVLGKYQALLREYGGILVMIFGVLLIFNDKIPFFKKAFSISAGKNHRGSFLTSIILGSSFALGWTPCVGPILGSILILASTTGGFFQGSLLLGAFSLGLAIPFLLIALWIGSASRFVGKIAKYLHFIYWLGGAFLIFLGYLLWSNKLVVFISWFTRVFGLSQFEEFLIRYL